MAHFTASRISGEDVVFPDELIIDMSEEKVTYRKGQIIGHKETTIRFGAIGCVSMSAGLLFSDVTIETNGGNTICAKGFTRSDAKQIVRMLS